jgi:release factor glutamine methyltransferase
VCSAADGGLSRGIGGNESSTPAHETDSAATTRCPRASSPVSGVEQHELLLDHPVSGATSPKRLRDVRTAIAVLRSGGDGNTVRRMRVITVPGVFQPRSDTWMLVDAICRQDLSPGAKVLDLCTGSGVVGVAAALRGASVTSADVSRRALLSAWLNARMNGARVRTRRGNLLEAVDGERFDLIVANPPYLLAASDELPVNGAERAWDAGRDGRALLDRICATAPAHLCPGGSLLLLHSSLCDTRRTETALAAQGLDVDVVFRHRGTLGPIMRERAGSLWADGRLAPGSFEEEIVIVRGRRPAGGAAQSGCESGPDHAASGPNGRKWRTPAHHLPYAPANLVSARKRAQR